MYHAAGLGGRGGSSSIDSVILRDRDADEPWTSASDGALEERRFYCQNWRADVVAVTRSHGAPWEFVRYSAYGEPTVYPVADVNRDGVVNLDDLTAFGMGTTTGDFAVTPDGELDLDFDGDIGSSVDIELFMDSYDANTGQSGKGRVSSAETGNRKGYAGYEWDHVISMSHVRHRVYWAEIGRWTRRDPIGEPFYEYVDGRPLQTTDSRGLAADNPCATGHWRDEAICLAAAVFHESRGQSKQCQVAVAWTIVNRSNSDGFWGWPRTVCEVVWQKNQYSDVEKDNSNYQRGCDYLNCYSDEKNEPHTMRPGDLREMEDVVDNLHGDWILNTPGKLEPWTENIDPTGGADHYCTPGQVEDGCDRLERRLRNAGCKRVTVEGCDNSKFHFLKCKENAR